jgi:argininosuccinate lyase
MNLWDKDLSSNDSDTQRIGVFTAGKDKTFDILLADADVRGSLAHAQMLLKIDLLNRVEFDQILAGLAEIEPDVEDVHSQIELLLTRRLGEAGKKIHCGRSRNDQVLVDIKLFLRDQISTLAKEVTQLFDTLQALSEKHKSVLLPGYTHFQAAMPSSFGLWFGAYAESLVDDMEMVVAAYRVTNKNPLGSGAGFGSSFPLDRELTTHLLGFESLNYNVVYAQMSRGKTEKILAMAMACLAGTLSKLAYDVCLYLSQNFGFISFPDALTTGSSIMPHKKNPDVFELIRARCNKLQSLPNELTLLTNNLPSGYHRDMQLSKESLFPAITELCDCLNMASFMLQQIKVKTNILEDEKFTHIFSVEVVNELVLKGVPFREAYKKVGQDIAEGKFTANTVLNHTHTGSMGNLCNSQIKKRMDELVNQIQGNNTTRQM